MSIFITLTLSDPIVTPNTEASVANKLENDIFLTQGKLFIASFLLFLVTPLYMRGLKEVILLISQ